jgi:FMN-dependent dehydrogenase
VIQLPASGGVSRGTDVVKALALGTDMVGIGRIYCNGLVADGVHLGGGRGAFPDGRLLQWGQAVRQRDRSGRCQGAAIQRGDHAGEGALHHPGRHKDFVYATIVEADAIMLFCLDPGQECHFSNRSTALSASSQSR